MNDRADNRASKITNAFQGKKAFIPFITGGDPDLETTEILLYRLAEAGASLIEIGIPFSDPIAEGPVIQAADERALRAGCTTDKLFDLVARARARLAVPLLFMTYYNPVFVYGVERFVRRCAEVGVDGLIVPDLPFEERQELLTPCSTAGVELIAMIAPTSEDRVQAIARESRGFLYCVSSLGVTGERRELDTASAQALVTAARRVTNIPCAIGFGISSPAQARAMAQGADGVIVGSAIVRLVAEHGRSCADPVFAFAASIREALDF